MENQKTINLLENTPHQPSNFRAKHWVEINYGLRETCNTNSQIKFKNSILKSSLCSYSDEYILVKEAIPAPNTVATVPYNGNKKGIFKTCVSFKDYISKINNTKLHNAKDSDE